ncbi:MAG: phosphoenolpyruvate--protein phosphotransferase [Kiritimatiellae bacterium]|nr:phosphoenolpyruvate--protein phosphotransferase [Kiritimatiellia bacterium]
MSEAPSSPPQPPPLPEIILRGIGVADGIAFGPLHRLETAPPPVPEDPVPPSRAPVELRRLDAALAAATARLRELQANLAAAGNPDAAALFEAQLAALADPEYTGEIRTAIRASRLNAARAVQTVSGKYAAALAALADPYLRERAADVRDVALRLLRLLAGQADSADLPATPHILYARDLSPSDLAAAPRDSLLALATAEGGPTSHTAILARSLGIPALVGIPDWGPAAPPAPGPVLLDGTAGLLVFRPAPARQSAAAKRIRARNRLGARLAKLRDLPSETLDGTPIALRANIESPDAAPRVLAAGADGVGLFRSEYLFMDGTTLPDEDRQLRAYTSIARSLAPAPVTVRTLDLGGDKLTRHLDFPPEDNPAMGCRALRLCLARPDLFKPQLRALLRAAAESSNLRIMYPMVNDLADLRAAEAVRLACADELTAEGIPHRRDIPVGVMVEVPSAALTAAWLATHVSFFSIGTNDLTQYTLAADRGNERVAHLCPLAHPAILRLIRLTAAAAQVAGIPACVCGEMAWHPELAPLLVGLGVSALSTSPDAIPGIKHVIRSLRLDEARTLADHVLTLETPDAILSACRTFLSSHTPDLLDD